MSNMQHKVEGKTLTLERTFNAPRQKVWDAFTKSEIFVKWWGPRGWQTEVKEFNFSEGGVNHYGMKCGDKAQGDWYGKYSWGKMLYSNIKPIDSYDYTDYFSDENGVVNNELPSSNTKMQFLEEEDGTKIISVTEFADEKALQTVIDMGMIAGVSETWDRLDEIVTK